MTAPMTINLVLEKGIQKEITSQRLYTDLSQRMTDPAAKDAFLGLVQEEQRH